MTTASKRLASAFEAADVTKEERPSTPAPHSGIVDVAHCDDGDDAAGGDDNEFLVVGLDEVELVDPSELDGEGAPRRISGRLRLPVMRPGAQRAPRVRAWHVARAPQAPHAPPRPANDVDVADADTVRIARAMGLMLLTAAAGIVLSMSLALQ